MAPIVITEAEILEELARAGRGQGPKEAKTAQELAEEAGVSVPRTRKALKALQLHGRLVVHSVTRPRIDGRPQVVPAYTITPAKRK